MNSELLSEASRVGLHSRNATELLAPAIQAAIAETSTILRVADRLVEVMISGGHIYGFGAGHSKAVTDELCSRAGGLRGITSMNLDDLRTTPRPAHLQLSDSMPEREPENGTALLATYGVRTGDGLIIATQSGRNGAQAEMARRAGEMGVYTVAVMSREHNAATASRHPEGLRLIELVDDVIDNHGQLGDAAVALGNGDRVASTSSIAGVLIAQLLNVTMAQELERRGVAVPVIRSANLDASER